MGKKKSFIDKKKAVTYSLVYRDPSEDPAGEDGGQRILAPVGEGPRAPHPVSEDYHNFDNDDGSIYDSEYGLSLSRSAAAHHDGSYSLSDERRRELLALGFPDDGYDYLKHLRDLGRGKAPPAGAAGGIATIPEDQELDGFEDKDIEGSDGEEDFTIYDQPEEALGTGGATGQRKKLDEAALVAAEAAAAAADGAWPSTSGGGGRAAASAAAGPGPSSARTAPAAGRSLAGRSTVARSIASTAQTHGSGLGPSVYVPAARLVVPKPDVKVVDARRLVVQPKGQDEAAAAAALAEVTAHARHTELHGTRGRLYQDLDELEESMMAIENGNDPSRVERIEGDEWADWLDDFVAGGGDDGDGGGGAAAASSGIADDEDEDVHDGGESEDPEDEDEDADQWHMRHRRQQQQQQQHRHQREEGDAAAATLILDAGAGAGLGGISVASSSWRRPERRDRKQGFEALDAQFERLAVEYDDTEIGALEDGRYEDDDGDEEEDEEEDSEGGGGATHQRSDRAAPVPAAGNCELSDFADVLDEFLKEHRAAEALEAEGLRPVQAMEDVALLASRPDKEVLAATKARIRQQMEASVDDDDGVRTIVVQEADRWDCESILSLTSNLENHPAKIVEPQRRTGRRGGGLIRLSAKTGMPVLPGDRGASAAGTIPEEDEEDEEDAEAHGGEGSGSDDEGTRAGSVLEPAMLTRRKGETAEERKVRKTAVKEARRNHRSAKKEMKTMFRQQATRAQKQTAGRSLAAGSTYIIP